MNAYDLKYRVLIQAPPAGLDEAGERLTVWTDVVTDTADHKVAAAIKDVTGRQYVAAQATQNSVQTTITIRSRAGITAAMRVLHGADTYDIEAALVRDRVWLDLMCKRVAV